MKIVHLVAAVLAAASLAAFADDLAKSKATVTTLITTPLVIEGLTNDEDGNLYAPGRTPPAGQPCPVYRVNVESPALTTVGFIPAPSATTQCSPSGLAFGPDGKLYVSMNNNSIYAFTPSAATPPTATVFASGVPGTNGLAFDWNGNVWTGDGTTGKGRVWRVSPSGVVTEVFRIQPMANEVNLASGTGGVGRDVRSLPPGTITVTDTSRNAANTLGSQPLVANGLAFDRFDNLYIADTARGAIWRVHIRADSTPDAEMGCDSTFTANTLCLYHVWVAHPFLEGLDGIVIDIVGNVWGSANERNALTLVTRAGLVDEAFRNPPDATTQLRNGGPLESPTSPVIVGTKLCTANSDGNRRDNSPSTAGEIGGPGQPLGKISCVNQRLGWRGMPLPVR